MRRRPRPWSDGRLHDAPKVQVPPPSPRFLARAPKPALRWRVPAAVVSRPLITCASLAVLALGLLCTPSMAAITPDRDASSVARAFTDGLPFGAFAGASFVTIPPAPDATVECVNG